MNRYVKNLNNYINDEFLSAEMYRPGDDMLYLPGDETEANFCTLTSIVKKSEYFIISLLIENEWTGEKYEKIYKVSEGTQFEMIMLTPNLACFLPPARVPVLAEVTCVTTDSIMIKPVGILKDYACSLRKI